MAQAPSTTPFFEVCHWGVPDIAGHSSSLDVLHAVGGNARNVVNTECANGYAWVYPRAYVSHADYEAVVKAHSATMETRRDWVPSSSLLKDTLVLIPTTCLASSGGEEGAISALPLDRRLHEHCPLSRVLQQWTTRTAHLAHYHLDCHLQVHRPMTRRSLQLTRGLLGPHRQACLLLRGGTVPLVFDSGAQLHVDTGVPLDLPTLPPVPVADGQALPGRAPAS